MHVELSLVKILNPRVTWSASLEWLNVWMIMGTLCVAGEQQPDWTEDKLFLVFLAALEDKPQWLMFKPVNPAKPQSHTGYGWVGGEAQNIEWCLRGKGECVGKDVKNMKDPCSTTHTHPHLVPWLQWAPYPLNKRTHMLKDECPTNGGKRWVRAPNESSIVQPGPPSPRPEASNQGGPFCRDVQMEGGSWVKWGSGDWGGGSCCLTRMLFIGPLWISCCLLHSLSLPLILSWSAPTDGSADTITTTTPTPPLPVS